MTLRPICASALAFLAMAAIPALAQPVGLFRAYLASTGNDTNACTLQQPCRLLPVALNAVAAGGEVWMLDSANYNTAPVSVTKSVTILAVPGAVGSVVATGGNAININTAGVKVVLRNLVIVPLPGAGGVDGVHMLNGAGLTIEGCLIANMPNSGLYVQTPALVRIFDSTFRGHGDLGIFLRGGSTTTIARTIVSGNANVGVEVWGSAGTVTKAAVHESVIDGSLAGVVAVSTNADAVVNVSVHASQIAGSSSGAYAQSVAGAAVALTVTNSTLSGNSVALASYSPGARVWAAGNSVSNNGTGLLQSGGSIFETPRNNALRNNPTPKSGTIDATVVME